MYAGARFFVRTLATAVKEGILEALLKEPIFWKRTNDVEFPYRATLQGETLRMRINDYPDRSAYTVMRGDREIMDINGFRDNWQRGEFDEQVQTPSMNRPGT
ncbi:hypothetical protein [Legionella oakridgensis]|uniref:Uncharacterized protein n=2 Tax=Legionella oakridgensis TaxID=29423 RepID=W0BI56_9GAMM|nr:hypothetical protein [Legionella oakridgensis]AHE68109.1 hypothetical protein Loa_02572 [Legionella oakridgensis ATCC 33761 = DSM 21215]ETO92384.1 hypothetical protein LOR_66c18440 [Legionella oakridgensis RV-2-2007]KTD42542.1 hypothetical protein Loak_0736 [Legionella oakridgensis]STY21084.1 Uncharacterised protein [Legionella longbeachae]